MTNKIILLYMIDKFDVPLSMQRISAFVYEEALMESGQVTVYLQELAEVGYLEKSSGGGGLSYYTITDDGGDALESFSALVPGDVKAKLTKYAGANRYAVKKDFESTANLFYDRDSGEYIVKCGVYEHDITLMEINLSVVSREQATAICNNWRENVTNLYAEILGLLLRS
ncbi:MAG: DUF4364 family protein [Defluviitaleaceae bacterium]|nr:DUF4364 family protein [Defluviitaleaceae bacterium]